MILENKIEISAPQELVWQVTVDVERWPEWSPAMQNIKREDSGEFRLGSSALIKQKAMPETRWTVTEIDPNHQFTWRARTLGMEMIATHILIQEENSVTSVLRVEMTGGMVSLLGPVLRFLVKNSLMEENRGLKQFCESRL